MVTTFFLNWNCNGTF